MIINALFHNLKIKSFKARIVLNHKMVFPKNRIQDNSVLIRV